MARQTRAQRRARRREQAEAGVAQLARARQAQIRPQQPAKTQTGARRREEGGLRRFLAESWGELKKVEWPSQRHVIQGTVVVLVACAIVGTYIWLADIAFKRLVQDVFLR
ncbi:MAG: preprotein translocase subunit SecE [Thermoleophilia bacterium]